MTTTWYDVDRDAAGEYTEGEKVARLAAAWEATGNTPPTGNLEILDLIHETARGQVIDYAPETVIPEEAVPARLVLAQLQQAINLWNAGSVSSSGDVGEGGFTFTPRPLDKTIRQIIRPVSGYSHAL